MLNLRNFTGDAKTTAEEWRECMVTEDSWKQVGSPGEQGGESKGYFVKSGELTGFAKPSKVDPEKYRPGHEKIASDLAFELGLPVPPVVLWRHLDASDKIEPCVSISLVPFHPIHKWELVDKRTKTAERIGPMLSRPASAMIAFDTWLANRDVQNVGNLLVGEEALREPTKAGGNGEGCTASAEAAEAPPQEDTKGGGEQGGTTTEDNPDTIIRAAYIDFAFSMSERWKGSDDYQMITPALIYPKQAEVEESVLDATIAAIEELPVDVVSAVVERIPDDFLTSDRRKITIDGLLHRKSP